MSRPADFEKARKRKARIKTIGRFILLTIMVFALFVLYTFRYEISSQGFGVFFSDQLALLTKQSRFPVALLDEPVQLLPVGRRIAVVTDSSVNVYDPVGQEQVGDRVTGVSTLADSEGNYLIIYSRGGNDLKVKSGETELFSLHTDEAIHTADVSKNGSIAVATASGSSSEVTVYDKSYREALTWTTDGTTVIALELDDKGQSIAVGSVWSDGGMISSNVRTLSVLNGKDIFHEQELSDELILALEWQEDGSLTAVTDRSANTLRQSNIETARFDSELAAFSIMSDGSIAAATGEYLTAHEVRLSLYSSDMAPIAHTDLRENVKALQESELGLLAFTGEKIMRFDENLNRAASMETLGALQASAVGNKIYYTTVDHLYRINLR